MVKRQRVIINDLINATSELIALIERSPLSAGLNGRPQHRTAIRILDRARSEFPPPTQSLYSSYAGLPESDQMSIPNRPTQENALSISPPQGQTRHDPASRLQIHASSSQPMEPAK